MPELIRKTLKTKLKIQEIASKTLIGMIDLLRMSQLMNQYPYLVISWKFKRIIQNQLLGRMSGEKIQKRGLTPEKRIN